MSIYDLYKTDPIKEKEGFKLILGMVHGKDSETGEEVEVEAYIQIAWGGSSNKALAKKSKRIITPYQRAITRGAIKEEKALELYAECYFETVIVGWGNLYDEDDREIPFELEECKNLFVNCPGLWDDIESSCKDNQNYKAEDIEQIGDLLGND